MRIPSDTPERQDRKIRDLTRGIRINLLQDRISPRPAGLFFHHQTTIKNFWYLFFLLFFFCISLFLISTKLIFFFVILQITPKKYNEIKVGHARKKRMRRKLLDRMTNTQRKCSGLSVVVLIYIFFSFRNIWF